MHALFAIGVAVGLLGATLLGYVVTKYLVERIAALGHAKTVRAFALGAALSAVVPACFPAYVLGGNFGGASAAFLIGGWAVAIGIGFGIALVLAICVCSAAVVGAILGAVISRALGRKHAA
jgi:hypothetical protein